MTTRWSSPSVRRRRSRHPRADAAPATGKGKFSTVYRAIRRSTNEVVALKRIHIADIMDARKREKTLKEVKLLQTLSHPSIIKYLDSFISDNDLIIVFEWAEVRALARGTAAQRVTRAARRPATSSARSARRSSASSASTSA